MESMNFKPVWTETFSVRSFDIGPDTRMRLSNVCSYLQEIAGKHATHLNVGYRVMHDTHKVWVLSRLFMNISAFPEWNHEFLAETWPLGTERIFFRRDYCIKVGDRTLISAASYWILLDLKSHRPGTVQIDDSILKPNSGRYAMTVPTEGFAAVKSDSACIHKVVYSDLDQNQHVNNARYVGWIMDCFPPEFHELHKPSWFGIEYKHEVKAGDTVEIRIVRIEDEFPSFNIEGRISGTGQTCFRSRIRFSGTVI